MACVETLSGTRVPVYTLSPLPGLLQLRVPTVPTQSIPAKPITAAHKNAVAKEASMPLQQRPGTR